MYGKKLYHIDSEAKINRYFGKVYHKISYNSVEV